MKLKFLVIPGFYGSTDIREISSVHTDENVIHISFGRDSLPWEVLLLRGDFIPEIIIDAKKYPMEYQPPYRSLSEGDFKKYKKRIEELIQVEVIDPLKEE